jgi:hypothetical protein
MNTLTTDMNAITVTFDSGEEISGRVEIKEVEVFNGSIKPQLVAIDLGDFTGNDEHTVEEVKETIICSVNETFEPSWHSDIWEFEYSLYTA